MSYRVDIDTIISDLIALFKNNLVALNQGMDTEFEIAKVDDQIEDDVSRVSPSGLYPKIFVFSPLDKTEEIDGIGIRCRKKVIQNISIVGITKVYMKNANQDNIDARNLASNIDEILRLNRKFSSQLLDCNPNFTRPMADDEAIYINMFLTNLACDVSII